MWKKENFFNRFKLIFTVKLWPKVWIGRSNKLGLSHYLPSRFSAPPLYQISPVAFSNFPAFPHLGQLIQYLPTTICSVFLCSEEKVRWWSLFAWCFVHQSNSYFFSKLYFLFSKSANILAKLYFRQPKVSFGDNIFARIPPCCQQLIHRSPEIKGRTKALSEFARSFSVWIYGFVYFPPNSFHIPSTHRNILFLIFYILSWL